MEELFSRPYGIDMVVLPPGSFRMGAPVDDPFASQSERPQHNVSIAYCVAIGKFPITFEQWKTVDDSVLYHVPHVQGWGHGTRPVVNISWEHVQTWIRLLNLRLGLGANDPHRFRLPSESEWEYACRAGTTTAYNTPNGLLRPEDATYDAREGFNYELSPQAGKEHIKTTPVGIYAPNAWGLHDMLGNVQEFCQDSFECYCDGFTEDGSPMESGGWDRVIRGGSFRSRPKGLRSSARSSIDPTEWFDNVGFRLARTV